MRESEFLHLRKLCVFSENAIGAIRYFTETVGESAAKPLLVFILVVFPHFADLGF
jgi:hypothetical protein